MKPASGFVLEANNQYYLITNRHVLSGTNMPADGEQEPVMEPHILKTSIHTYDGQGENIVPLYMGARRRITVQLYYDNDTPKWIEHRANTHQPMADVVALPLPLDEILRFNQTIRVFREEILRSKINTNANYWSRISAIPISVIDTEVEYCPPDTVHIIGYPLGWAPAGTNQSSSAFWRTSSIASEIQQPGMTQAHAFFVDPCAPDGMAGSPVVGMKKDRIKLLGVYSDRSTAEFGANAGLVWDAYLVKDLISAS